MSVSTEELERLLSARRNCGHEFLVDDCSDCANWRTVRAGWSELWGRVSYEEFAAEVLAGRTKAAMADKALEAISKGSRNAALPSVVALLAELRK